ncbi:MAG: response regulator transcription factor [Anaerolineae bacterium]|nr:response regulator transcription factor [Anaerolineae bacterium]
MASLRSALVVARPSPLRDGLAALLGSMPLLSAVHQADSLASALRTVTLHQPTLILVDADLPGGEAWALLRQVKRRWPQTWCVVMTDTIRSIQQAEDAGANQVLLKGYPAAKLSRVLEQLLGSETHVGVSGKSPVSL